MKTNYIAGASIGLIALASHVGAEVVGYEKYTYDAVGNIVEKSIDGQLTRMCYDVSNRLTATGFRTGEREPVSYDDSGRPVLFHDSSGQVIRRINYGYANKVTAVVRPQERASSDLFYNAEGHMVGVRGSGEVSAFIWDGNVLAANAAATFTNEDHFSGGVPVMTGDQGVLVADCLGNTLSIGHDQMQSTAYGEGTESARLTGKPYVEELEAYVFQHRLYSPGLSRWTTPDPLGYPDSVNNIAYMSDPNGGVDPLGTAVKELSNTVANPSPSSTLLSYTIVSGSPPNQKNSTHQITFSHSGTPRPNNAIGFIAKITHDSQAVGKPPHSEVKAEVTIYPDDTNQVIFYSAHPATYLRACPRARKSLKAGALAVTKRWHESLKRLPCLKFRLYDLFCQQNHSPEPCSPSPTNPPFVQHFLAFMVPWITANSAPCLNAST